MSQSDIEIELAIIRLTESGWRPQKMKKMARTGKAIERMADRVSGRIMEIDKNYKASVLAANHVQGLCHKLKSNQEPI